MKSKKKGIDDQEVEGTASQQNSRDYNPKQSIHPWKMEDFGLKESRFKIFKDLLKKSFSKR